MQRTLLAFALSALFVGAVAAGPVATAPGQNKLTCFDGTTDGYGYGGTCTMTGNGARGVATLSNQVAGNDYAGVYTIASTLYGMPLSTVSHLSFQYTGSAPGAGAPRFSIPLDLNDDGATDEWAYVAAYYCNDGAGLVDAINDPSCTIFTSGGGQYANWAAMATALPGAAIADDNYVFVIADEPGTWSVGAVKFGPVVAK